MGSPIAPATFNCNGISTLDGPLSPFYSLHYHFGMLLGVADFEVEQAYHRGKLRLHNSWLHREGVAWGMGVAADIRTSELRVSAGLAQDALGRELFLEQDACVNVPAWFEAHRNDPGFTYKEERGKILFDAHIVIRFKACLSRQVPALSEPCEGANTATAYSRVFETVEMFLRPGKSRPAEQPYHRLRLLFGLEKPRENNGTIVPEDAEVLGAARDLNSFRRFAALDEIDLRPPDASKEVVVVLADVTEITLNDVSGKLSLASAKIDVAVRPSHVATSTTQELLVGTGIHGGPAVLPSSFHLDEGTKTVQLVVSADLAPASVEANSTALAVFDPAAGWRALTVNAVTYDNPTRTIRITYSDTLAALPAEPLLQVVVKGSGPTPVLGANLIPLGNGNDFTYMHRRS